MHGFPLQELISCDGATAWRNTDREKADGKQAYAPLKSQGFLSRDERIAFHRNGHTDNTGRFGRASRGRPFGKPVDWTLPGRAPPPKRDQEMCHQENGHE